MFNLVVGLIVEDLKVCRLLVLTAVTMYLAIGNIRSMGEIHVRNIHV